LGGFVDELGEAGGCPPACAGFLGVHRQYTYIFSLPVVIVMTNVQSSPDSLLVR
jgi:hypothetical protein